MEAMQTKEIISDFSATANYVPQHLGYFFHIISYSIRKTSTNFYDNKIIIIIVLLL